MVDLFEFKKGIFVVLFSARQALITVCSFWGWLWRRLHLGLLSPPSLAPPSWSHMRSYHSWFRSSLAAQDSRPMCTQLDSHHRFPDCSPRSPLHSRTPPTSSGCLCLSSSSPHPQPCDHCLLSTNAPKWMAVSLRFFSPQGIQFFFGLFSSFWK